MSKFDLSKIFKFLRLKWNIIVAAISVLGVLVFNFIPQIDSSNGIFLKVFIFVGINAIVWTLIEIKLKLDDTKQSTTERFDDMRQARPYILEHIYQCMKTNKSEELYIEIIGGRIRTISDMIREIKNEIVTRKISSRNVRFRIYTINPEFIRNWNFSKTLSSNNFKERNEGYANVIKHLKKELIDYNDLREFKSCNIKVEVEFYDTFPVFYSYKIGNEHIYWGFFTWNNSKEDFVGPENPCYYLDKKHSHFDDFFSVLSNKTEFYQNHKMQ